MMRFCYTSAKLVTVICERQFTLRVSDFDLRLPNRVKRAVTAAFLCMAIADTAAIANSVAIADSAAIAVPVEQGATLPDATLQGLNGPSRKLSEFRGRPLIINVWASWCGPCREEMASLERLAWRSESRYFAIIGISTDDDADRAKDLLKEINATISQFIDKDLRMENTLGASQLPLTVLIDGNGRVLEKIYGARQWDGADARRLIDEAFHRRKGKQDSSRSRGAGLDVRGGRMAQRQREIEARAAAGPIETKDFSTMRLDDGAADRQPQAHPRRSGLAMSAGEFLEHRILAPDGQPWSIVRDRNAQVIGENFGCNRHRAARRGVFGGVFEQVYQHALDQQGIESHQRQVGRKTHFDAVLL